VGPAAIDTLRHAFVDIAFIGADGMDAVAGLTCRNPDEAAVNRVIVAQAKRRIAVVDRSKFAVIAQWQICPVEVCDIIITDSLVTESALAPFGERSSLIRRV
jgi:DeoR/GlpR family transcriptional regulator of sugar metabolism